MNNRVGVILEWTISNTLGHYQQLLLLNASFSVVPSPEVEIMLTRNMSINLTLSYNTLYNVSITQPGICEQPSQTTFIELNYSKQIQRFKSMQCHIPSYHMHVAKCYNPERVTIIDVIIEGFEDPALEGGNITFSCRDGLTLIGPNSATCARNGEWEPDPRMVNCIGTSWILNCASPCTFTIYGNYCIVAVDRETAVTDPNGISTLNPTNPLNPTSSCEDLPSVCLNTGRKQINCVDSLALDYMMTNYEYAKHKSKIMLFICLQSYSYLS